MAPVDIRPPGYIPQGTFSGTIPGEKAIERRRRLADVLAERGTDASPTTGWGALARVVQSAAGAFGNYQAAQMEQQRKSALAQAMQSGDPDAMIRSGEEDLQRVGMFLYQQRRQQAQDEHQAQVDAYNREKDVQDFDLRRRKTEYDMQPDFIPGTPELAKQYPGAIGSDRSGKPIYPPANPNNTPEGTLLNEMAKKRADAYGKITEQGTIASGMSQDMEVLDQLLKMAPSGPIAGRLAERFPQISTAGAAATAIIRRVAPSLRTPGTGSQSDIEYEGFLQSMPRLANNPQGNTLIIATLRNKAGVDMERAGIIDQISNGQLTPQQGSMKLSELAHRSIIPEELKGMMQAPQGAGGAQGGGAPMPQQGGGLPFEPDPRFPRITPEVWSTWPIEKQTQWKRMK